MNFKGLEKIDTRDFAPDEGVSEEPGDMAIRFKRSFSREVTVHFVGTWYVYVCVSPPFQVQTEKRT